MPHQPHLMDIDPEEHLSEEEKAKKVEYLKRLAEKLKDPEFRKLDGFPIGDDEDILSLSNPPYYTACPNPFLDEILGEWNLDRIKIRENLGFPVDSESYHREPFSADVSEGKNNQIYNAHGYHTKVPHKAIMRYILHYTDPGDIVLDGFCGTGMTGVAAQLCGDKQSVEEMELLVKPDGKILEDGEYFSTLGERKPILIDLSTAATFIASNYNNSLNINHFNNAAKKIMKSFQDEYSWMYDTWHPNDSDENKRKGKINFVVWSEVFQCPDCGTTFSFWDVAYNKQTKKISDEWPCPQCNLLLSKNPSKQSKAEKAERTFETIFDPVIPDTIRQVKHIPVQINYSIGKEKYFKDLDDFDYEIINKISNVQIVDWYPTNYIPEGDKTADPRNLGFTHVHHFYTKRNLILLSYMWGKINQEENKRIRLFLQFLFQSLSLGYTKLNRYGATHYSQVNRYLNGTLYVSSLISEVSLLYAYSGKLNRLTNAFSKINTSQEKSITSTNSSTNIPIADNSLDYIFVDPPFGSNLMYSELNFIWESWLKVFTNNEPEAISNKTQNKGLPEYQRLMENCFITFYRLLKPGRWLTVEFHNSKNSVWNSIQEALSRAGFVIADVRTIDKKQGTYNQVVASGAVKQDLIISAYKPDQKFEQAFSIEAGTEKAVWDFVNQHLSHLPIVVIRNDELELIAERQPFLLYDRMIAYHIQKGITIPITASDFYRGLQQKFPERDGMYFLSNQVPDYDKKRLQIERISQLTFLITDEKSSIQWLNQILNESVNGVPQTYQEIQPKFLQKLQQARHEQLPELLEILEQNFLQDEQDKWYVPDPNKASDLEKIRNKTLLREFNHYLEGKKKLKQFRTEAVRAGFADAWQRKDFATIVKVAERLPEAIIQEDPDLLMYYDNASLRVD